MADNPHKEHRQRVKKRYLKEGIDSFELHNILELFLFYGIPRIDTNEIAHNLLHTFGSMSGIINASYEELIAVEKISPHCAILITLIPELQRICQKESVDENMICDTHTKLGEYIAPHFISGKIETVFLVCLSRKCKVTNCVKFFEGSICEVGINNRRIAEIAIKSKCSEIVLAHNHPFGVCIPSSDDLVATREVIGGLNSLNIRVVDHLIFSANDFCSMSEMGYIKKIYEEIIW